GRKSARRESVSPRSVPHHPAGEAPRWSDHAFWILCAGGGSVVLLALTNTICQDVAVIPFLWILPLSLYLLTFIICFGHPDWYRRAWLGPVAALLGLLLMARWRGWFLPSLSWEIALHAATVLVGCLITHGELVQTRPTATHLTGFYLAVALGGALGGVFVALVAPVLFEGYWETELGLTGVGLVFAAGLWRDQQRQPGAAQKAGFLAATAFTLVFAGLAAWHIRSGLRDVIDQRRNFYGVQKVRLYAGKDPANRQHLFYSGSTIHGMQFMEGERRAWPTLYFGTTTGIGRLFQSALDDDGPPRRLGLVGLGVGVLSAYARPGDHFRYYEINPAVEALAREHFHFLADCPGTVEVVTGDARLSLEREPDAQFDVLVLDAFTGGAIPMHLLTREAFELYRRQVRQDGVIACHITNENLDLLPVLARHAQELGWQLVAFENPNDLARAVVRARWAILTANTSVARRLREARPPDAEPEPTTGPLWTDQRHDLFSVLRRTTD
ncbi:MAG TPA: hypothetical protein DCY13_16110, partial [Verrucomicrobiales bacterium]|nr:hypothetical protein [Verrucomicrobiales bacterium]